MFSFAGAVVLHGSLYTRATADLMQSCAGLASVHEDGYGGLVQLRSRQQHACVQADKSGSSSPCDILTSLTNHNNMAPNVLKHDQH